MKLFDFTRSDWLGLPKIKANGYGDSIDRKVLDDAGKHNIYDARAKYEQTRARQVRGDREYFGGTFSNFAYIPAEQYAIRDIQSQRFTVNQRADGQNTPAGQTLMAKMYRQVADLYSQMAAVQASYGNAFDEGS